MIATLVLLCVTAFIGYYELSYRALSRALDADLGTLRRLRWDRPVLRGTQGDANATLEELAAIATFKELPDDVRAGLAASLHFGRPLDPAQHALVTENTALIAALRAATQQGFARAELVPELGEDMRVPPYPKLLDVVMLMLAQAQSIAPDECLRIAADAIRIGQDNVPGGPLEAASVSMRITSVAAPVFAHCAMRADAPTLRRTAHELHILATRAPPTGATLELHDIVTASKLRLRASIADARNPVAVVRALLGRPALLAAWAMYTDPTRFRKLVPARYPDALDDWRAEGDVRSRSRLPFVAQDAGGVLDYLADDMRGQALLRALTVGFATLAERAYLGRLPAEAASVKDPELRDPFRGKPLNFRARADGTEIVIWSVGEDLRDDNGSDEWGDAAPQDVTVHLPLNPLTEVARDPVRSALSSNPRSAKRPNPAH